MIACSSQSALGATATKVSPLCVKHDSRPNASVVTVVDRVLETVLDMVEVTVLDTVELAVEV